MPENMAKMEPLSDIISTDTKEDTDKLSTGDLCSINLPQSDSHANSSAASSSSSTPAPTTGVCTPTGSDINAQQPQTTPNSLNGANSSGSGSATPVLSQDSSQSTPQQSQLSQQTQDTLTSNVCDELQQQDLKLPEKLSGQLGSDDLHLKGNSLDESFLSGSMVNVKSEFGKLPNLSDVNIKNEGLSPKSNNALMTGISSKPCTNSNSISQSVPINTSCQLPVSNGVLNNSNNHPTSINNSNNGGNLGPLTSSSSNAPTQTIDNQMSNTTMRMLSSVGGPPPMGAPSMHPMSGQGPILMSSMSGPMPGGPMNIPNSMPGTPSGMPPTMSGPPLPSMNTMTSSSQSGGKLPMDSQYMQQQSQIFVFTTMLANEASEAIQQKRFNSIISYHANQANTQKFLEKNPFKGQYRANSGWPSQANSSQASQQTPSNGSASSSKRIKQSNSPQQQQQQQQINSSNNQNNSPYTYRPPSNSSVMSNQSGNFRPGPSPGIPCENLPAGWPNTPGDLGWQSPQQQQQSNFQAMQNNMRMMSTGQMPPNGPGPNRNWLPDPNSNQFAEPDQTNGSPSNGPPSAPPANPTSSGGGRRRKNASTANNNQQQNGAHCSPISQNSSALNLPNPQVAPSPGRISSAPGQLGVSSMGSQQQHPPPPYSPATSIGSMRLPNYASPGPPTPSSIDNNMMGATPGMQQPPQQIQMPGNSPKCGPMSGGPQSMPSPQSPANAKKKSMAGNGPPCGMMDINQIDASGFLSPSPMQQPGGLQINQQQQRHQSEPQLMPVPSPQQIQYLNTFDDQELTIKRQRNLSARDADLISPELDFLPDFSSPSSGNCGGSMGPGNNGGLPSNSSAQAMQGNASSQQSGRFIGEDMQHCQSPMGVMGSGPNNGRFPGQPGNVQQFAGDVRMAQNVSNFPGPGGPQQMYGGPPMPGGRPPSSGGPQFGSASNAMMNSLMNNDQQPPVLPLQPSSGEPPFSSNHLQNLQKMNPPFDIGAPPKMDSFAGPGMGPNSNSSQMQQQMGAGGPQPPQLGGPGSFEMHSSNGNIPGGSNNGPGNLLQSHPSDMQQMGCPPINCPPPMGQCGPGGQGPPPGMAMMQPPMNQGGPHSGYPNNSISPMSSCGQASNGFSGLPPSNLMGSNNGPMLPPSPAGSQPPLMANGGRSPGPLFNSANSGFPHSASPKLTCSPSPQQQMMMQCNQPGRGMPYGGPGGPPPTHPMAGNRPAFGNPRGPCPPGGPPPGQMQMMQQPHGMPPRPGFNQAPNIQMNNAKPNTIQYMPSRPIGGGPPNGPNGQMMPQHRAPNLDFLQRYTSPPMDQQQGPMKPNQPPYMQGGPPGSGPLGPMSAGPNVPPGSSPMGAMGVGPMHMSGGPGPQGPPNMHPPSQMGMGMHQRPPPHMMNAQPSMDSYPPNSRVPLPPPGQQQQMQQCGMPPGQGMLNKPIGAGGPGEMMGYMNAGGPNLPPGGPSPGGPGGPPNASGGPPSNGPQQFGGGPMSSAPGGPPMGAPGYKPFYPNMQPPSQDPIYTAQYQQFQQQLYATNSRNQNQMGGPVMNQMPPNPHNQPMRPNGPFFGQPPK